MMRMRDRGFGKVKAALVALALSASPAWADCVTPTQWQEAVLTRSVGVSIDVYAEVAGEKSRADVARMNERPPQTNLIADHILVLSAVNLQSGLPMSYLLVAFFNQGCLAASGRARAEEVRQLLQTPEEPA